VLRSTGFFVVPDETGSKRSFRFRFLFSNRAGGIRLSVLPTSLTKELLMNTTISTVLFATLGIFMFSLSCFGQDARLHDLSVFQKYDHGSSSNKIDEIDNDFLKWLEEQVREPVPDGPQGPGPFLPETDTQDDWRVQGPVIQGAIVVGNPADLPEKPKDNWTGISNGFIWMEPNGVLWEGTEKGVIWITTDKSTVRNVVTDALVHGLIDIEDYISKGGEDMMSDAVLMAYRQGHRGESGREVGTYPWTEEELAVLIFPPNDNDIDPKTGLLNPPWGDDGIIDQEKELPSDDDRSEHPGDK
jgi:hypothetical protein